MVGASVISTVTGNSVTPGRRAPMPQFECHTVIAGRGRRPRTRQPGTQISNSRAGPGLTDFGSGPSDRPGMTAHPVTLKPRRGLTRRTGPEHVNTRFSGVFGVCVRGFRGRGPEPAPDVIRGQVRDRTRNDETTIRTDPSPARGVSSRPNAKSPPFFGASSGPADRSIRCASRLKNSIGGCHHRVRPPVARRFA
jgi:hypothetical protein